MPVVVWLENTALLTEEHITHPQGLAGLGAKKNHPRLFCVSTRSKFVTRASASFRRFPEKPTNRYLQNKGDFCLIGLSVSGVQSPDRAVMKIN